MEYFKIDRRGRRTEGPADGRTHCFLTPQPKTFNFEREWMDGRNVKAGLTHGRGRGRGESSLGGSYDRTEGETALFILE